jgi:hypothetical protein
MTLLPNIRFTVEVSVIAMPSLSMTEIWDVP